MSKFSKGKKKGNPAISTAALPDIVFMLLFFFMVTTVFKDKESRLIIQQPKASETEELEKNVKLMYFWIGKSEESATAYRVQVDDMVIPDLAYLRGYLQDKRIEWSDLWLSEVKSYFKVDIDADMRTVQGVQEQLRDFDALKVAYSAKQSDRD